MNFNRLSRSETGSLPLTLLVAIVVAGVVVTLFTVVNTGVSSSGRDRDFAAAIQVADMGIQEAYIEFLAVKDDEIDGIDGPDPLDIDCEPPAGADDPTVEYGICEVETDDGGYVWEYERRGDTKSWEVRSWGTYRDNVRLVTATVGQDQLIEAALLAIQDLIYVGGGTTNPGGVCSLPEKFSIGVGRDVRLNAFTGACITGVTVYNRSDGDADTGLDFGNSYESGCGDEPNTLYECDVIFNPTDNRVDNTGKQAFEDGGVCAGRNDTLPSSLDGDETYYCLRGSVELGVDQTRSISNPDDGLVTVYVEGDLTFSTNSDTNFSSPSEEATEAGDLLFYVGGSNVIIRSTAKAKAAVVAPDAFCRSIGGAGANGEFAGAMICRDIELRGNWTYDSSVEGISGSDFGIRRWAERPPRGGPPFS